MVVNCSSNAYLGIYACDGVTFNIVDSFLVEALCTAISVGVGERGLQPLLCVTMQAWRLLRLVFFSTPSRVLSVSSVVSSVGMVMLLSWHQHWQFVLHDSWTHQQQARLVYIQQASSEPASTVNQFKQTQHYSSLVAGTSELQHKP